MSANDVRRAKGVLARHAAVHSALLAALTAPATTTSCTTEDVDWAADAGVGGGGGGEGGKAAGGSTGGSTPICPKPASASYCTMPVTVSTGFIADFNAPVGVDPPVFGGYLAPVWGGVYAYPATEIDACSDAGPAPYPILSQMGDNHWRISGTLGTYSGFGLWWNCTVGPNIYPVCMLDLSAFSGLEFKIQGNPGPMGTLVLQLRTAENMPPSTDPASSSCGSCMGTCAFASKTIAVTSTASTITVPWADLTGGAPRPFDPHQITGIEWQFSFPGSGTFPIDLVLDDIQMLP